MMVVLVIYICLHLVNLRLSVTESAISGLPFKLKKQYPRLPVCILSKPSFPLSLFFSP